MSCCDQIVFVLDNIFYFLLMTRSPNSPRAAPKIAGEVACGAEPEHPFTRRKIVLTTSQPQAQLLSSSSPYSIIRQWPLPEDVFDYFEVCIMIPTSSLSQFSASTQVLYPILLH